VLAKEIGAEAKKLDISLSCHGPYFVNLCSSDANVISSTKRHFITCAQAAHFLGASPIVFHPGFYQGRPKEEAAKIAKKLLREILAEMEANGYSDVAVGAELTGKKSAYGDLDEIIDLAQTFGLQKVQPVIDFGHYHARISQLKTEEDFAAIFDAAEKSLGSAFAKKFHCHFSEISFSTAGEYKHLPLADGIVKMNAAKDGSGEGGPPFQPLAKLLHERGYSGTVVCETPLLEKDALKLQKIYEEAAR